ncbi:hypothetical protein BS78_02G117100 [Paspalum vaginatum]|nr:hypothetical protein BS78_02G117100 [Paspalum vaginatum]
MGHLFIYSTIPRHGSHSTTTAMHRSQMVAKSKTVFLFNVDDPPALQVRLPLQRRRPSLGRRRSSLARHGPAAPAPSPTTARPPQPQCGGVGRRPAPAEPGRGRYLLHARPLPACAISRPYSPPPLCSDLLAGRGRRPSAGGGSRPGSGARRCG